MAPRPVKSVFAPAPAPVPRGAKRGERRDETAAGGN